LGEDKEGVVRENRIGQGGFWNEISNVNQSTGWFATAFGRFAALLYVDPCCCLQIVAFKLELCVCCSALLCLLLGGIALLLNGGGRGREGIKD